TVIDDCYNAAPDSMKAGLDLLSRTDGETVAILGDMGELGDKASELHREVGIYAAEKHIGLVAAVGELAKNIASGCIQAGGKAVCFESKAELIDELAGILPKDGAVLVKASHFMGFSEIVDSIKGL
ncbi:MAG: glutamate ligase domain-containing protein, partial [Clostridia bacterium]